MLYVRVLCCCCRGKKRITKLGRNVFIYLVFRKPGVVNSSSASSSVIYVFDRKNLCFPRSHALPIAIQSEGGRSLLLSRSSSLSPSCRDSDVCPQPLWPLSFDDTSLAQCIVGGIFFALFLFEAGVKNNDDLYNRWAVRARSVQPHKTMLWKVVAEPFPNIIINTAFTWHWPNAFANFSLFCVDTLMQTRRSQLSSIQYHPILGTHH